MKRWLKYISPYKKYFIFGPICMIVEVIGEVLMPKLLAQIIDNGVRDVYNADWHYVALMCGLMVLLALAMMAGGVGGAWFGAKASVNFATDLRRDTYSKIQRFSFANIDRFSTGSLVTRLTNDITQIQNFVNMLLRMCLRAPGMLIGAIIMAIGMAPNLTSVLLISVPLMAVTIGLFISKGFPRFQAMQTKIDQLNSTVQEDITNIRVVKSFVRQEHEISKFGRANSELKKAGMSAMNMMILIQPAMMLFMNLTTVAVLYFGSKMIIGNTMGIGELTAFINYINQILMSLMSVVMIFMQSSRAMASGRRICEVLDEEIDISDETASLKNAEVTDGRVEFRNVSFRYYKNSREKVLDNINLTIEAGQTVGIIGSTGCGKTTLVSLIPRLYDADQGEVLIDGIDARDYSLTKLRDGVGMVLQKNLLFSGTIAENLRWGDADATDGEISAAADNAQADGFVRSFPDGYDTVLDQGGTNVSGGQKQRLCIARALLKRPKILILDDSTSAVDTATEAKIRQTFKNELSGSTKIIIAQRITSVMDADSIVVMDDGRITGIGTHEQLLRDNEEYKEIYYSQMDKEAQ